MGLRRMMGTGAPSGAGGDGEDNIFTRDRETPAGKRVRQLVVLGIVVLVLVVLWLWMQGGENRALNAMAPAQRHALFQETRTSFRTLCLGDSGASFEQRCRQQADFLTRFPECDDACHRELAGWTSGPAR